MLVVPPSGGAASGYRTVQVNTSCRRQNYERCGLFSVPELMGVEAMVPQTRRYFLKDAALGVAAVTFCTPTTRAAGAAERVRIGVIGCGNQGSNHIRSLAGLSEAEIAYVADVDQERLLRAESASGGAKGVGDFRRVLDDATVDAVTIATPDHWHVPVALLALEAGKHVYVEKPCSHNVREGQLLVAATRRHNKVVAQGTQSRSSPAMRQAMQLLREGVIGDVLIAKCWNWQMRGDIGRMQPSDVPSGVDYDTWVGPAEWIPFQANRFHYNWHWWYNFGCGDLGNDGIHEFDYALWGLGVESHPSLISATGGKYFFDDDQEFPDTMQVTFEYPGDEQVGKRRMLIYEQRLWSTTYPYDVDSGAEYIGTKGKMFVSKRGKFEVRGERNRPLDVKLNGVPKGEVAQNMQNWIECIRSGGVPYANVDIAHRTATAAHLGNIATRLQRTLRFDPEKECILGDDEAQSFLSRRYRDGGHWGVPVGV
jgi:predicted dehydrogenase